MPETVFISYRRSDLAHAERLFEALRKEGVLAWYDAQVGPGEDWRGVVAQALQAAPIFVLLYSAAAAESDELVKELAVATLEKKLIVPVRLENVPPKGAFLYELARRNWFDAFDDPKARLEALAQRLAALVKAGATDPSALLFDAASAEAPAPAAARASPPPEAAAAAVLERPAVAIMPFQNWSGDKAQDYFADGVTEDLITALAAWRWFPVIARNSTFCYKGKTLAASQVGEELGARYIVEGAVRRAGEHVRISARLSDAGSDRELWAKNFDRKIGDVFALQDEITRAIVGALEPQLTRAEQQRAMRKLPENFDAWDLSLQALAKIRRGTVQSLAEAERMLTRAVELDRTSAYAQSMLALARFQSALSGWQSDPKGSLLSTHQAAKQAVELDDDDWLAHALLGIATLWSHGDYDRAIDEEETAIELNPSAAMAYHFFGCVLTFGGWPDKALPNLEAVLQLDPHFQLLPTTLADIGLAHFLLGDCRTAVKFCERAIGEQSDHARAWQRLAAALAGMGRTAEAAAAFGHARRIQPEFGERYLQATYPFRDPQHARLFRDGLQRAGWQG